ncbi:MAG TPA: choice-of-anchor Q domain-containing protein [Solirubrobacterales bacterium]
MKRAAVAAISLALFAALAGQASAAQRYAAPQGKGTACFQNAPCSLGTAVEKSKTGDEVIVEPGTHSLAQPASPEFGTQGIDIHGDPSRAMPTVVFAEDSDGFVLFGESRLSYLSIEASGFQIAGISCYAGDLIERVVLNTPGVEPTGLRLAEDCAVRDALVRASGEDAVAIFARPEFAKASGPVRNVTAIATGEHSVGIAARSENPAMSGDNTLDVKNAIASGGENDLRAIDTAFGSAHIAVANSNFDVASDGNSSLVKDLGGNQGGPPRFVDAGAGDFRQAAGSPTIDAGVADQIGALDLIGVARIQGSAPDIGAYEFTPPPAGQLLALSVGPRKFKSISVGESTGGGVLKSKPPVRTVVSFSLSAPATVTFTVERKLKGRKVGGKCVRQTRAKRCPRFQPVRGSFAIDGVGSGNRFTFTGKVGGKALKRGRYRLVGVAGGATRRSRFQIAGVFRPAPK